MVCRARQSALCLKVDGLRSETPKRRNTTILATLMPSAGVRRPRMSVLAEGRHAQWPWVIRTTVARRSRARRLRPPRQVLAVEMEFIRLLSLLAVGEGELRGPGRTDALDPRSWLCINLVVSSVPAGEVARGEPKPPCLLSSRRRARKEAQPQHPQKRSGRFLSELSL